MRACTHAHTNTHTHTHTSARAILNIFIFQCCTEPDQLGGGSDFRVKNGIVNNLHSCEIVECTGIKSLVLWRLVGLDDTSSFCWMTEQSVHWKPYVGVAAPSCQQRDLVNVCSPTPLPLPPPPTHPPTPNTNAPFLLAPPRRKFLLWIVWECASF